MSNSNVRLSRRSSQCLSGTTNAMNDNDIRAHILAATSVTPAEAVGLTTRMVRACWPGGAEDHYQPASLEWLRYWRPQRFAAEIPTCSCATGRCTVCN